MTTAYTYAGNSEVPGKIIPDLERCIDLDDGQSVSFIYAQWYIQDYLSGTKEMTFELEGAYMRFMANLYDRGKPLPDDDAVMARIMRCSTRVWRRIKEALAAEKKLIQRNGALTNSRFEKERQKRAEDLRRSSEAAKSRWAKVRSETAVQASLPEVSAKFDGSLDETSLKLAQNFEQNVNEINESPVKPQMPVIIQSQSYIRERESQSAREGTLFGPTKPDDAPVRVPYVNGSLVKGSTFGTLLYESVDAIAHEVGIDTGAARAITIANAKQWEANGARVRDPLARITAALKAHKRPPPKAKKMVDREYTENFEKWWKLYPRKEGKGEAFDVWERIGKVENHRKAYKELQRQLPELTARANDKRGNFCVQPAKWLRQCHFDNEVAGSATGLEGRPNPIPERKSDYSDAIWQSFLRDYVSEGVATEAEAIERGLKL